MVVVTANPPPTRGVDGYSGPGSGSKQDDRSDRSILKGDGIVRTNEVRVESHRRCESDSDSDVIELHAV